MTHKNMIIGTAGHIDHGKTTLIKALTGTDTDRLAEEKKRGITIELGFAYMDLPNGEKAGIIDVPGHEKFIKNMLAGVGGVDLALFIISADEGVMPQTREHLDILSLLHIDHGIIVLTKADTVEPDWLELVRGEVRAYLKDSFLADAPIHAVSSITGLGLPELRAEIARMAETVRFKDTAASVRMPIDRVFTMDGFGTVVTGTLVEGTVRVGESLQLYPTEEVVKVKQIQNHSRSVDAAYAGQRVALNLAGVRKDEVERGEVLAAPGTLEPTMLLDARLSLLKEIPRELRNRARIRFHHGTKETLGRLILLDREQMTSGEEGLVQLRLEEEVVVKKGDRFVIRFYSPMDTIGGGVILDPNPAKHKRFRDDVLESLMIREAGSEDDILEEAIRGAGLGATPDEVARSLGKTAEDLGESLNSLLDFGTVIRLSDEVVLHLDTVSDARGRMVSIVDAYHKKNPFRVGIGKEELRSKFLQENSKAEATKLSRVTELLIQQFVSEQVLEDKGHSVALYGYEVSFQPVQKQALEALRKQYREAGFMPPSTEEAIKAVHLRTDVKQLLHYLVENGELIRLSPEMNMEMESYLSARSSLIQFLKEKEKITLAEFRDLLGVSRKYALALLDHFDAQKLTRKIEDYRVLLTKKQ
ncbi:MAG: selenocysteine-specific translation elongation factor [Bacillota bacterium]|nr:selenocysteine-specific translation elongation factor [Bacillota bacterium]